jgi:hypothetical protein
VPAPFADPLLGFSGYLGGRHGEGPKLARPLRGLPGAQQPRFNLDWRAGSQGQVHRIAWPGVNLAMRRTLYDTHAATATLLANAGDLPTIDFITANMADPASDAEAMAAFTDTVRQQARQPLQPGGGPLQA